MMAHLIPLFALLAVIASGAPGGDLGSPLPRPGSGPFTTVGSKVYDASGAWVVFRGIGLSCTEYMARPIFPGRYGYDACFGGLNGTIKLNGEIDSVLNNYLLPDSAGGPFVTQPSVTKAAWPSPYDQVLSAGSPRVVPVVRIPVTSASYLFDVEANELGAAGYRWVIDLLVAKLTGAGVAVIIDQHGNCAGGGKTPLNCSSRQGPMSLRDFGEELNATLRFWDNVSSTYAGNPLVFFETYNEPHVWYQALYGGDPLYAGHAEMLRVIRRNAPTALVLISSTGYAQDAAFLLALFQQYARETGAAPTNVLWVLHPYQGMFQGVWISLRSTMRLTLALMTTAPVIYTELGQYCCSATNQSGCGGPAKCNDYAHGAWFVHNLLNMAAQLDLSWLGWAWRGTNANGGNCSKPARQAECGYPDMRDESGAMTDGSGGGANWRDVWVTFAASAAVTVLDAGNHSDIGVGAFEVKGFLPRPCIVPDFGMGDACGWPLNFNSSALPFNSLWNQSVGESVLPGLPPAGPPSACFAQACPGFACSADSPIVPEPHPCTP
jgi:hypothetical protein